MATTASASSAPRGERREGPGESLAPGSPASLREANQRRVIRALREGTPGRPALTQAEIARSTLLAPATVSNIVKELSAVGLLESRGRGGRRGSEVRISPRAGVVVGIAMSHADLRLAIGDLAGEVLAEGMYPLAADHRADEALALVEADLAVMLAGQGYTTRDVLSVGVGLPAPIGPDGLVTGSSILPGWVGVPAQERISDRLGVAVHVENDANLGALAEARWGVGRGHDCMAYLEVSSGVGAGLVIGGELFRGGAGTAGEIGHLTVDDNGPVCRCGGRGCLEAYASSGAVLEILHGQHPGAGIDDIVAAASAGDLAASRVLEDVGTRLGDAVAVLANLVNPTCVVVGGSMAAAGSLVIDPMRIALRRHAVDAAAQSTHLVTSSLRERAPMLGGVLLALDRVVLPLPT